jgi:GNAT superfamily N-acetyltransferase
MTDLFHPDRRMALIEACEANYRAYCPPYTVLPGISYHEEPGAIWFIANGPPGNMVLHTDFAPDAIDAHIDDLIARMSRLATGGWWQVTPLSRPADLAEHLLAHGLTPTEDHPVMVMDLAMLADEMPLPQGTTLERVTNDAMLREWWLASAAGFETAPERAQAYHDTYAALGYDPECLFQHYTAYQNGLAVASTSLLRAAGLAGIYDVSTIPVARRQGLATTITWHTLREARAMGEQVAVLQSSPEGYAVYQRLGFREFYTQRNYAWQRKD